MQGAIDFENKIALAEGAKLVSRSFTFTRQEAEESSERSFVLWANFAPEIEGRILCQYSAQTGTTNIFYQAPIWNNDENGAIDGWRTITRLVPGEYDKEKLVYLGEDNGYDMFYKLSFSKFRSDPVAVDVTQRPSYGYAEENHRFRILL